MVGTDITAGQALRECVQLARLADQRGFHRFWVTEHHCTPSIASSSPAVLLAHLAAHTARIRLGSGGVMLLHHTPLVIAEQFGTLQALAPGRVDLGIGRATGANQATTAALRPTGDRTAEDFPRLLTELLHFLHDDFPEGHPYSHLHPVPGPAHDKATGQAQFTGRPSVWLLGSSEGGARLAAELGLPFVFAHHLAPAATIAALDAYRDSFRPSAFLHRPYAAISVSAFAADEAKEARHHILPAALTALHARLGEPPAPSPPRRTQKPASCAPSNTTSSNATSCTSCTALRTRCANSSMTSSPTHEPRKSSSPHPFTPPPPDCAPTS